MGPVPPGIRCKLYAFLNLVKFSSIAVCSTNLIVCGRHLPPSHHNSAPLALQQPRLTMMATKSSFPAITSPEATQEDDNEKDSILVSTSCENGKKAPVFIPKFNLSPVLNRPSLSISALYAMLLWYSGIKISNLTLVFATLQLRIPQQPVIIFSSILDFWRVRQSASGSSNASVHAP